MRRKESYLENQELFLLKAVVKTKDFKGYLKERELDKKIPSLLEYYGIKI
ncbi:hypothetical protein [Helicobacter sp. UBA3407]|nr:hypothetical protein [Helicobacter sp. UBA3407]